MYHAWRYRSIAGWTIHGYVLNYAVRVYDTLPKLLFRYASQIIPSYSFIFLFREYYSTTQIFPLNFLFCFSILSFNFTQLLWVPRVSYV